MSETTPSHLHAKSVRLGAAGVFAVGLVRTVVSIHGRRSAIGIARKGSRLTPITLSLPPWMVPAVLGTMMVGCAAMVGSVLPPRAVSGVYSTAQSPTAAMAAATATLASSGYQIGAATPNLLSGTKGQLGAGDGARTTGLQILVEPIILPTPAPIATPTPTLPKTGSTTRRPPTPAPTAAPPAPVPVGSRLTVTFNLQSGAMVAGGDDRALLTDFVGQLRQRLPDIQETTP